MSRPIGDYALIGDTETAALVDGVRNKIEPPEPVDKDIYDLPPEELTNLPSVPRSLEEALAASSAPSPPSWHATRCRTATIESRR